MKPSLSTRIASTIRSVFRALVPACREAARLQSESLDRPLSVSQRLGLRLHLLICKWCRRYGKQLRFLRHAVHDHPEELATSTPQSLSPEARERLKQSLRNESK